MSWFERARQWMSGQPASALPSAEGGRVVEPPCGSTSFHLWWQGIPGFPPIVECSAVLEVLQEPVSQRLYFWALQASFEGPGGRQFGAAHTGLQWNPRHPGGRAVNWGGYGVVQDVQSVLDGTDSPLPGILGDRNTRNFDWQAGVPYRFRIFRGSAGWAADVTDLLSGQSWHLRELHAGGDRLTGFTMWSELFCACTDPQVVVRWSDLRAVDVDGKVHRPRSVRCTFPSGGCGNTDSASTPDGIVQVMNTARRARDSDVLAVPEVTR